MTAMVSPDKNGRITVPDELIRHAGITSGKAVVIGLVDHAEIWDSEELAAYEKKREETRALRRALREQERAARYRAHQKEVEAE